MNFYKHHIGDYAQATAHLSFVEDAAYSRLIRKYYAEEKPIPADLKAAQRLVGARSRDERAAVNTVLEEFFELHEDGWHNKRCDLELEENRDLDEDRDARAENERERQRRHRAERKRLFEHLRAFDIVPAWDTRTEALRELLERQTRGPVAPPVTVTGDAQETHESRPVTPPVTRTATANQTPDTRHQTPEEEIQPPTVVVASARPGPPRLPACPVDEIVALYHRHLPMLPRVGVLNDGRKRALGARWREVVTDEDIRKSADPRAAALDWFGWFFEHAARSDFLTGKAKDWRADIDFLLTPSKFAKVVEGAYHKATA